MDLDLVPVGNIDDIIMSTLDSPYTIMRDGCGNFAANGAMTAFIAGQRGDIWKDFRRHTNTASKDDQTFIAARLPVGTKYFQDELPGQITDWKCEDPTEDTRLLVFHGHPRPHTIPEVWDK